MEQQGAPVGLGRGARRDGAAGDDEARLPTRGNARPMRSASMGGRPAIDAAARGASPLTPTISRGMRAAGGVPVHRLSPCTASGSSVPDGSISRSTDVDPMQPTGTTRSSEVVERDAAVPGARPPPRSRQPVRCELLAQQFFGILFASRATVSGDGRN
jgi:hypothetical protein